MNATAKLEALIILGNAYTGLRTNGGGKIGKTKVSNAYHYINSLPGELLVMTQAQCDRTGRQWLTPSLFKDYYNG